MTVETKDTRERILDVALDLFNRQGFDKTSLREVAEELGVTKAALYYHFKSKDAILIALHERLHDLTNDLAAAATLDPDHPIGWRDLFHQLIERAQANRDLITLHERNRAAMERLHSDEHETTHEDLERALRTVMSNPKLPPRVRVRFTCALGVMIGMVAMADQSGDIPPDELVKYFCEAVDDLLDPSLSRA